MLFLTQIWVSDITVNEAQDEEELNSDLLKEV